MPLPSLLSSCVQLAHSPIVPMDHQIDILALGVLGKGRRGALGLLPKPLTDPETLLWQMSPKPTANDVHAQEGSCGWPGSWLSSGDGLMRVCLGGGGAGGNQDALSNPPLPSQAVPRGGKRPPAAARARTQLCRGVGKGRDQAAEEDCACAPGPARAAASGYARRVLPGRERGRGSTRAAAGEPGLLELARGCRKVFPKPSKSGGKRTGTKGRAEERLQPSLVKIIASLLLEAKAAGKPSVR